MYYYIYIFVFSVAK